MAFVFIKPLLSRTVIEAAASNTGFTVKVKRTQKARLFYNILDFVIRSREIRTTNKHISIKTVNYIERCQQTNLIIDYLFRIYFIVVVIYFQDKRTMLPEYE